MTGVHCCRTRAVLAGFFLVAALFVGGLGAAAPAAAQDDDTAFDANETESTIQRVRLQLLGVAAAATVLLCGYIWHTDPERRLRVATRRRDSRERAGVEALDEEFLLPIDVEEPPVAPPDPGQGRLFDEA